jgi:hypothetical protein
MMRDSSSLVPSIPRHASALWPTTVADDDDDCDFDYDSSSIRDTEMSNLDSTSPDAYNEHEGLPLLDRDGEAGTRPSLEILNKATSSASDTTTPQLGSAENTLSVEAPVSVLLLRLLR